MGNRILLGTIKEDFKGSISGEKIYITKHSFDCGWYWSFGYIGNKDLHTHFETVFLNNTESFKIKDIFESTNITQDTWWILRDLFIQSYALKKCAEVYRYGGGQTTEQGTTDIIKNKEMEDRINKDLETILNKIWEIL